MTVQLRGNTQRNRCAYLIGRTQSHRDELLADFTEIYKVRSKIVHRGKAKLSRRELRLLFKLQWICGSVIREEVRLLLKEV